MSAKVTCREYDKARGVPVPGCQRLDVSSRAILGLIRRGKGYKEVAERFGITKSTICYRLHRDFREEYRRIRKNPTFAQHYARCAAAYKAYQETGSTRGAAKKLDIPKTTALSRIRFMKGILKNE